jgi:hypothetical protein
MASPETNGRRTIAIRLCDVDIKIRRRRGKALYEAAVADRDIDLAMRIDAAIERPSQKVYWLPEDAVREALR